MGNSRTFICLMCGKRVTISYEEYQELKNNPICETCRNASEKEEEDESAAYDVLKTRIIAKTAEKIVKKIIDVSSPNPTPSDLPGEALQPSISQKDRTISDWEHIGCLGELYDQGRLSEWNDCIGLYMHKINGKVMYIGRAIEYNNGGFRKRLSDYCRDSGSARKHPSGQKIYANRYRIQTYLLVVGNDEAAKAKTILLEKLFVGQFNPPWNDKLKSEQEKI